MYNPYIPEIAEIKEVRSETSGERAVKTFKIAFLDAGKAEKFIYKPGQCVMVSVFGEGESMISISSSPTKKGFLEITVMRMGRVTDALHKLDVGDLIGVRGPFGNGFPVEEWRGKNLLFVGGGLGLAPLWSVLNYVFDKRTDYKNLQLLYGARTENDLIFYDDLKKLEIRSDIDIRLSIDVDAPGWFKVNWKKPEETVYDANCRRFTAFVPMLVSVIKPSPTNAIALTCGPPIMIGFVVENLKRLGFKGEQIYMTLENKMKCGIGLCGRCNVGNVYLCKDGPVVSYAQYEKMLKD